MNKTLEKIIFVLINLVFSCSIFLYPIIHNWTYLLNPFPESFAVLDNEGLISAIVIFFLCIIAIWYLKINIFRFIYKAEKFFPYLHKFFDRFSEDSRFRDKTFVGIFMFDLAVLYLSSSFECFFEIRFQHFPPTFGDIIISAFASLILGGGALTSYLMFFLLKKN